MLEQLDLKAEISKETWKATKAPLRDRLYDVAHTCWNHKIPVLIILEGVDTSGKSEVLKFITEKQDPRGFRVEYFTEPRTQEKLYPWLRRFWLRLPKYGEITIFNTSWYRNVLYDYVLEEPDEAELKDRIREIVDTERMLLADGVVILKFFLHIDKKEQKKRLKKATRRRTPGLRVTERDWLLHKKYGHLIETAETVLEHTDQGGAPWRLIPATQDKFAMARVMEIIVERLERFLKEKGKESD